MFRNYFKTAWKNLTRNKVYSFINVAGLSVGIACSILIFLWIEYNTTFNDSVTEINNIYNVKNNQTYGKDFYTFSATPALAKDALQTEFPGVVQASRHETENAVVSVDDKNIMQSGAYVDPAFVKMFNFSFISGNANGALQNPSGVVISEKLAKNYFGDAEATGKTVLIDKAPYTVSAVYRDLPQNMQFYGEDFFLPYDIYFNKYKDQGIAVWGNNWTDTWVQLNPKVDVAAFNKKLEKLIREKNSQVTNQSLFLYPLKRMNVYGQFINGKEDSSGGKIQYINLFSLVAVIILIIACINFMNLSTARSQKRAKEIGIHKVLGSRVSTLIGRLLSESLIIAYAAVVFAVIIAALVLPSFSTLIGIELQLHVLTASHLLFLLLIGAVCGLVAGSYPAFYLSGINTLQALKSQITKTAGKDSLVRKGLVVTQFAVSIIIITAVVIIYNQIQFTRSRDLGFDKNNVLYLPLTPTLEKNYPSLRQSILSVNGVSAASLGAASPMQMYNNGGGYKWEGKNTSEDVLVTQISTDADYLNTLGIKLNDGRGFSANAEADSMNIIINESFAKLMGKEGHVGAQIWRGDNPKNAMTVIGIAKDFIYNNMNEMHPEPLVFYNNPSYANYVFIRINSGNSRQIIASLQAIFQKWDAAQPFDYHFLDKDFEAKFRGQQFIGSLATIFGCLAIFISCLGLLGLTMFTAEQRRKEIGVRKVIGAGVSDIVAMLSKDVLRLVVLSAIIATPVAWWAMNNWLQDFAYRIHISWWMFLGAGFAAFLIALLTISFQAIKAAIANPVKSLRTE